MKGMVHLYTGSGKGKTSSALGLAIRALGAGYKVFMAQFLKAEGSCEFNVLRELENIDYRQYGRGYFIDKTNLSLEDIDIIKEGLKEISNVLKKGKYDLIIFDEIVVALKLGAISFYDLIKVLENRDSSMEIVLTGRGAGSELVEYADLVTEMKNIKHYHSDGVEARKGIEY